jgi:hypothetical protein
MINSSVVTLGGECLEELLLIVRKMLNLALFPPSGFVQQAIQKDKWLFSTTANGAKASAMLYSIIETAKANDLIPFDYIAHCLKQLSGEVDENTIEAILPWNVKLD